MKKLIFLTISIFIISLASPTFSFAQGMVGFSSSSLDNASIQSQRQEEQEGKKLLDDLNNKTITCSQFKDADFEKIGEYFMGQSIGDTSRHIAMNEMMKGMMGEKGEEQTHVVMGKRLSGCDVSATFPSSGFGWMPMMQMMWGGPAGIPSGSNGVKWSAPFGLNSMNTMMNFGYGFGFFGWLFMILWWVLIIAAIVALVKWIIGQFKGGGSSGKSALNILKERYARGEIDQKEFEEKKKDLVR